MRHRHLTPVWIVTTMGIAAYMAFNMFGKDRGMLLPGETTSGHHQIEGACNACHTPFRGVRQNACLACHQADLQSAEDSHGEEKFTDPRYADDLALLDARQCATCHVEHRPEITGAMGVTLPEDFCRSCHADVADERPTHKDLAFDSCGSAGCHNYHDNRALYEDFLVRHGEAEPATFAAAWPQRNAWISRETHDAGPLGAADADSPPASSRPELIADWANSAHAAGGVSCSDCHAATDAPWSDHPPRTACSACHELEYQGFTEGRHGMRWAVDLDPTSPAMARLPMHPDALDETLDCGTCHNVHTVNVREAATDACLSCHADEHSNAYADSPHARLWELEMSGDGAPGSGVSCASCHLPREERLIGGEDRIVVQHNQNANLRPNEKMIREVCMTCHSLALSIDALADPELIRNNFSGMPSGHVRSIDMALSRTP